MKTKEPQNWNMVSEIELVYKSKVKASERPLIKSAAFAYQLLLSQWEETTLELAEQSKVLLMSKANRVMGIYRISTGGISGTVVDPRLLFTAALKANASAIILAHNHPSGNLQPSEQDLAITNKIRQAGQLLDITLLDHLIITSEGFFSFAEEGLI